MSCSFSRTTDQTGNRRRGTLADQSAEKKELTEWAEHPSDLEEQNNRTAQPCRILKAHWFILVVWNISSSPLLFFRLTDIAMSSEHRPPLIALDLRREKDVAGIEHPRPIHGWEDSTQRRRRIITVLCHSVIETTTNMDDNNRTKVVIITSIDDDDEEKILSFLTPRKRSLTSQVLRRRRRHSRMAHLF